MALQNLLIVHGVRPVYLFQIDGSMHFCMDFRRVNAVTVNMVPIAAYHAPLGGQSLGRHPLVTHFFRSALRLRPPV